MPGKDAAAAARALEALAADVAAMGPVVSEDAAALILSRARPPRRSGRLAASGRAVGSRVVYAADHAMPVHAGTRVMRAQPWLADAATQAADQVAALAYDALDTAVSRAT